MNCKQCDKPIVDQHHNTVCCSTDCRIAWRYARMRGTDAAGWGKKRFRALARDGFRCTYCGVTAGEARLVVDHVVPRAAGGTDEMANLATACDECNSGKHAEQFENLPTTLIQRGGKAAPAIRAD